MAEAEEHPKDAATEAGAQHAHSEQEHAEPEAEGPPDPSEHIKDHVLFGIDSVSGKVVRPYDAHGHLTPPYAAYTPAKIGPFKLEFTQHMFDATVAALLIFILALVTARRVLAGLQGNRAPKGGLANAFEAVVLFVRDEMVEPMGGHHLGHYTPLFITYFVFILLCNLLGLIPEFGTATGNFSITLGLAVSVYGLIWLLGLRNQGLHYLVHLVPPGTPLLLWPLMFALELLGPIIKCFVLSVRLFANMIAGHLIIGSIVALGIITAGVPISKSVTMLAIGIPLSVGLSLLEVMVCFIQAYVFTLLAVIFIGGAVHPEH